MLLQLLTMHGMLWHFPASSQDQAENDTQISTMSFASQMFLQLAQCHIGNHDMHGVQKYGCREEMCCNAFYADQGMGRE